MKTIMIIEDDESLQECFSVILANEDYQLVKSRTGHNILSCEAEAPDLFILDKNISGVNGLELCRFIKSSRRYEDTPVIMISATPGIQRLSEEAGADAAVEKPFSMKHLRAVIAKWVTGNVH